MINFCSSLSADQTYFIQKRFGSSRSTCDRRIFHIGPTFSFFPAFSIPQVGMLPPFFVSKMHLPIFFPKAAPPKSDHKSFPQEEPPVLQLCPIVLVCDWVVASHILLGILSLVISANWELPTCALTYKLKPRRCDSVKSRKEIVFTNVAAATRDADATCSMKTALCP